MRRISQLEKAGSQDTKVPDCTAKRTAHLEIWAKTSIYFAAII